MKPKHLLVLVVGLVFALTSAAMCADNWLVIKDKNGKCSVIKSDKEKTPATIADLSRLRQRRKRPRKNSAPRLLQKRNLTQRRRRNRESLPRPLPLRRNRKHRRPPIRQKSPLTRPRSKCFPSALSKR